MIFFLQLKEKELDGNKFVSEALQKKSSLAIVNRIIKIIHYQNKLKLKTLLIF